MRVEGATELGVRDLRSSLTRWLRRAERGERIVVTINGTSVAQIGPIEKAGPRSLDELAAVGLIIAPLDSSVAPTSALGLSDDLVASTPADLRVDRLLDRIRGR